MNQKSNQNELNAKSETIDHSKNLNANSDVALLKLNFIIFCNDNETENIFIFALMLVKPGQTKYLLEYTIKLYKIGHHKQSFGFFKLIHDIKNVQNFLAFSGHEIYKARKFFEEHLDQFE